MKLLIASNNQHKFSELSPSFRKMHIECCMPSDIGISLSQDVECFQTYHENAKAKIQPLLHAKVDAILADDSGLEVRALGNLPGIHSARFSLSGNEDDNRKTLLEKMKNIPFDHRQARFVCILCLWWKQEFYFFQGTVSGFILEKERGDKGFGYDPLFFIPSIQKSFSEISQEEKLKLSHRGKALEKCTQFLSKRIRTEGGS